MQAKGRLPLQLESVLDLPTAFGTLLLSDSARAGMADAIAQSILYEIKSLSMLLQCEQQEEEEHSLKE